jgi:hypothetical protein
VQESGSPDVTASAAAQQGTATIGSSRPRLRRLEVTFELRQSVVEAAQAVDASGDLAALLGKLSGQLLGRLLTMA